MKVNRLETHDRLEHLIKDQSAMITQGAEDCLKRNDLSLALQEKSPYVYLWAHARTAEDGVNKRLVWQPRLSKPEASPNSYLFRAHSNTDIMEICWMIPAKELWGQHKKGNVTENEIVTWSIQQYKSNRKQLEAPEKDDLSEAQGQAIYTMVYNEYRQRKLMEKTWYAIKQESLDNLF